MQYKYEQENIPNTIAEAILEIEKQNRVNQIYHNNIHRKVEDLLGHRLSDRQFVKYINKMTEEKLLERNDPTRKRGSKVLYPLTDNAKRKYGLKILGTDIKVERRKSLYNLLIFFEIYKRNPLLTEKQLSKFLNEIGSSIGDFENFQEISLPHEFPKMIYKSIKGVEILGFPQYDAKTKSNRIWYYTVIPGFSVEEFIEYQRLLKSGREPRPFSTSPTRIPFVVHMSYTEKEVEEAIVSLKDSSLIQQIESIIRDEKRYNIVDESLRGLIYDVWLVRILDYELLVRRWLCHKPTDRDKKYLEIYLGEKLVDKMIAGIYEIRRQKKEKQNKIKEEQAIKEIEENRRYLVHEIANKYEKVIHENEVVRDIIEEICYSSCLSSNSK